MSGGGILRVPSALKNRSRLAGFMGIRGNRHASRNEFFHGREQDETAARQFGWDEPIGKTIQWMDAEVGSKSRTVIGVTKNFHFESLHEPVEPLMIH